MDVTFVADQIKERIVGLSKGRELLAEAAMKRARAIAEYEKEFGMTLLKLRNNQISQYGDQYCKDLPVSIIEKVAKGVTWKEKLAMEQADAEYKVIQTKLTTLQAELNGFQSINRHMSVTAE